MARYKTNRTVEQSEAKKSLKNKVKKTNILAEGNFRCHLTNGNTVYQKYKIGNAF
jgi:hypothetical protein